MNGIRILAIILIVGGVLGLAYGGFTYTSETQSTDIGPIELTVNEKNTVNIPIWLGIGSIVLGVGLLFVKRKG